MPLLILFEPLSAGPGVTEIAQARSINRFVFSRVFGRVNMILVIVGLALCLR
jgi:hypothetical protein